MPVLSAEILLVLGVLGIIFLSVFRKLFKFVWLFILLVTLLGVLCVLLVGYLVLNVLFLGAIA